MISKAIITVHKEPILRIYHCTFSLRAFPNFIRKQTYQTHIE